MSTSSCTGSATETQSQHVLCISDRLTVGWVCASLSVVPWDCMTIRGKIPLKGTRTVRHRSGQVLPSRCPVQVTSLQPRSRCKSESHPHLGLNRTNSFLFIEEGGKKKSISKKGKLQWAEHDLQVKWIARGSRQRFIADSSNKSLRCLKNELSREVPHPLHLLLLVIVGSDLFCKSLDHSEVLKTLGSEN